MIKYVSGNLLNAKTEALVNTVNTVGVMGKGIALQFKKRFPKNFKQYQEACKAGSLKIGELLVVRERDLMNERYIINFPTKNHWKSASEYHYIELGLEALQKVIIQYNIKSIAIPPLGCGNGGLDFDRVKALIEKYLGNLSTDIQVFEPNAEIKSILQKENSETEVKLTPARAMLIYLLFRYEAAGEQSSLFAANKIAYFLQRSGEKLRLTFEPHHFGPYSVQVNHVLFALNGKYLSGLEQNTAKPFEALQLNYERFEEVKQYIESVLTLEQKQRMRSVLNLLHGFESSFSLELISSIDYISKSKRTNDFVDIQQELSGWNIRKQTLYNEKHIRIAVEHLKNFSNDLYEMA